MHFSLQELDSASAFRFRYVGCNINVRVTGVAAASYIFSCSKYRTRFGQRNSTTVTDVCCLVIRGLEPPPNFTSNITFLSGSAASYNWWCWENKRQFHALNHERLPSVETGQIWLGQHGRWEPALAKHPTPQRQCALCLSVSEVVKFCFGPFSNNRNGIVNVLRMFPNKKHISFRTMPENRMSRGFSGGGIISNRVERMRWRRLFPGTSNKRRYDGMLCNSPADLSNIMASTYRAFCWAHIARIQPSILYAYTSYSDRSTFAWSWN